MCNARSGDAFVVQAGPPQLPWTAVVDAGPPGTAEAAVVPALQHLDAEVVDLLAVTHIDNDHIGGAIELVDAHRRNRLATPVQSVWHNSFRDLTGDRKLATSSQVQRLTERLASRDTQVRHREALVALVASVGQGVELADMLARTGLAGNPPFDDLVVAGMEATRDGNPTIRVLSPSHEQVAALRRHWERTVNQQRVPETAAVQAAAQLDASVTNLASLVILVEADGRRVLFTGDARGDHVVRAVRDQGLLVGGVLEVDVLKVPHHGSERSCTQDLFDTVVADHYVVSGDGRHGNPSPETARRLGRALRGRAATVWMSHDVGGTTTEFGRYAEVALRDESSIGVEIEL